MCAGSGRAVSLQCFLAEGFVLRCGWFDVSGGGFGIVAKGFRVWDWLVGSCGIVVLRGLLVYWQVLTPSCLSLVLWFLGFWGFGAVVWVVFGVSGDLLAVSVLRGVGII